MRRITRPLLLLLLYFFCALHAQNLVPNPSFEGVLVPPCDIMVTGDFAIVEQNWYSPTDATPDVYSTVIPQNCFLFQPNSTYPGPIGFKGTQLPRTGNTMAGFGFFTIAGQNHREYVQVRLNSPLIPCRKYEIEFYVSLGDFQEFAIDRIGANLATTPTLMSLYGVLPLLPQVQATGPVTDVLGWTRVSGIIEADQAYEYLTIGNFFPDDSVGTTPNPTASGQPGTYGAYYFLEDVAVTPICLTADLGQDQTICLGDSAILQPQGLGCYDSLRWSTGETSTTISVKEGGNYSVTLYQDTCATTAAVSVTVNPCPPILDMANVFSPNGDGINDVFLPAIAQSIREAEISVFDRWGRQLFQTKNIDSGWDGKLNGADCPEGVYFVTIRYQGKNLDLVRETQALTLLR
jgi:gliding motility-associated-like protein